MEWFFLHKKAILVGGLSPTHLEKYAVLVKLDSISPSNSGWKIPKMFEAATT